MTFFKLSRKNGKASLMKWVNSQEAAGPLTEEDFNRAIRQLFPCNDPPAENARTSRKH